MARAILEERNFRCTSRAVDRESQVSPEIRVIGLMLRAVLLFGAYEVVAACPHAGQITPFAACFTSFESNCRLKGLQCAQPS